MARIDSEWAIEHRVDGTRFIRFDDSWKPIWSRNSIGRVFRSATEAAQFAKDLEWAPDYVRIIELKVVTDDELDAYRSPES